MVQRCLLRLVGFVWTLKETLKPLLAMRRKTKILVILGAILALGGVAAWQWESILFAYVKYEVRGVTTSLPHCDRVEVFHLGGNAFPDGKNQPKPGEGFPIRAYGSMESKILESTTLTGAKAEALAAIWRAQTFDLKFSHLCHSPVCGFRFYSGDKLTFETSVCFLCSNFYVTDVLGSCWWGFDGENPKAKELLKHLQDLFPNSVHKPK